MEFITVFQTLNPAEAELISSQLEAADFDVTIANEFAALTLGSAAASGLSVKVPEAQAADARALIDATINSKNESPEAAS
jgi:hypothetical protein